jgi:hypothetical protein
MMKGTIGFCRKKAGLLSKVIRWFTRSDWSHTYIIYQDTPEILVAEAGTCQVQLVPITKYESSKYANVFFVPRHVDVSLIENGTKKVRGKIETTYGWLQILGFIPMVIARRLLFMKIPNPARAGIICSELVLLYLRELEPGYLWDSLDRNAVSPEDLYKMLLIHPGFEKVEST